MKKLAKEFHEQMGIACYPIHPFPVYLALIIALLCPLIVQVLQ
jgi:hypothetical protein